MKSLRVRLVMYLLVPFVLLLPIAAALNHVIALLPVRNALDQGLERLAIVVAGYVHRQDGTVRLALSPQIEATLHAQRVDVSIAFADAGGHLIDGDEHLAGIAPPAAAGQVVFFDHQTDDRWRVAALGVPCGDQICQLRVAETGRKRELIERDILLGAVAALVALMVLISIVTVVGTRQSLRPIEQLRSQMAVRSLDDLQAIEAQDVPDEIDGLVEAINHLLQRLREAAASHHQFIANAAHQLRTPLASLLARIELARKQVGDPGEQARALAQLQEAVERMARVTSQLLALARSESNTAAALSMQPCDLRNVAAAAARAWVPRTAERDVDLGFELEAAPVIGEQGLLRELLDNLIDNALRHGGRNVTVRCGSSAADAWLEVEDDGPGIPASERERVFERFVRGAHAVASGSGLGLAIVRQIAQHHRATVELHDGANGRGLRLRLSFPHA